MQTLRLQSLTFAFFFTACSSGGAVTPDGGDLAVPPDCDPLVPSHCGFPFPSNYWLADDAKSVTGKHVVFPSAIMPTQNGKHPDPAAWSDCDGFSAGMSVLAHLPRATATGLPDEDHLGLSVTAASPTILLDTKTGKLVPHIAELDQTTSSDEQRTFIIRPVIRLGDSTRYIVAIRHVVDAAGKALVPSPAFASLRDGTASSDARIEKRRALYADIFMRLAAVGVAQADLQLAWDYSTASRENNTRWFLSMRDDALAKVGADGPAYVVDQVIENPNPNIRRRILGHMTVPLYCDSPDVGAKLVFGDGGLPRQNGTGDYPFIVQVANSTVTGGTPGAILQNGHGLLGQKEEGQDGFLAHYANEKNYVTVAVNLVGFAEGDALSIVKALSSDFTLFRDVFGRQHQGMLNQLLAMRMMKGRFARDPNVIFNGKSVVDTTQCYYRGDSQGGIMGTTYMAVSTDVKRGQLGEAGMPYDLLLSRSVDFNNYFGLVRATTETALDIQIAVGMIQMLWDRIEPSGYAPYIRENMLPNTPSHEILLHNAIGDHQVTTLGAHIIARSIGARNVKPVNREVWGIEDADAPLMSGSAMQEFDFGLPKAPVTNIPMSAGADPHDSVRVLETAIDQMDTFLRTGVITQPCKGPCKGL